jgi:hypothetical protein
MAAASLRLGGADAALLDHFALLEIISPQLLRPKLAYQGIDRIAIPKGKPGTLGDSAARVVPEKPRQPWRRPMA